MATADLRTCIVMVVDGHADTLDMFHHVLQTTGAKVITAPSALRALAVLRTVVPSIIVTNIEIPDIDGFSFIAAVRDIPATRDVPMIATTGMSLERHRQDWQEAGFARAVVKPVDPFVLCAIVADVIGDATATKAIHSNGDVDGGVPSRRVYEEPYAGTIPIVAVQRLQAAARASCEATRRLRQDSRDIREQASLVRITAARVRAERPSRAAAARVA